MSQTAIEGHSISKNTELLPAVEYLPFVRRIALRLIRRLPSHVTLDDLMGAGLIGLLEAMQRYDPKRVPTFENFAEFRIRGAMLDELRSRDLMARDARIEAKKIEKCIINLSHEIGGQPDEKLIADRLGISTNELRQKLQKLTPVQVLSMNYLNAEGDYPGKEKTPFDEVSKQELLEKLRDGIKQLSKKQQQVFHLYYQEELTMKDIGLALEVTESRVCQILAEGTIRLRALLSEDIVSENSPPSLKTKLKKRS